MTVAAWLLRVFHTIFGFAWIGGHFYWDTFVLPALESKGDWRTKVNFVDIVNRHGIIRWFTIVVWLTIGSGLLLAYIHNRWNKWILASLILSLVSAFWGWNPLRRVGPKDKRTQIINLYKEMAGSLEVDLGPDQNTEPLEVGYKKWLRASAVHSYLGFIILIFMWISAHGTEAKIDLKIVTPEEQCVESREYMRARHMELLNEWKESVVREGKRTYVATDGKKYDMSLTRTCLKCHWNKAEFCDQCHNLVAVGYPGPILECWDCHTVPEKGSQWKSVKEDS